MLVSRAIMKFFSGAQGATGEELHPFDARPEALQNRGPVAGSGVIIEGWTISRTR
jgi:hypothetical protein